MTFRTTFRDTLSSRQIALIDLPCTKNARRILAIVSTISIPISAPMIMEASVDPQPRGPDWMPITPKTGSLFHAETQGWIERHSGAEPLRRRRRLKAGRVGRHRGKCRAAAVRPALQADAVARHVGACPQIGERPVGVERADRHLVQLGRTGFVAATRKPTRIAARAEAVDQQRHIALLRPHLAPGLVPFRKGRGVIDTVR